jgi:ankyrin repeat protein
MSTNQQFFDADCSQYGSGDVCALIGGNITREITAQGDALLSHYPCTDCDINDLCTGWAVIHRAATACSTAFTKKLILAGANVNLPAMDAFCRRSPLHFAASRCRADMIRMLIHHGASVDARDKNQVTPLMCVGTEFDGDRNEQLMCIKVLLDRGADIDAVNSKQMSTLCVAVRCKKVYLAEYLLGRGASFKVSNYLPLKIALKEWHEPMFTLLLSHPDLRASMIDAVPVSAATSFGSHLLEILQLITASRNQEAYDLLLFALYGVYESDVIPPAVQQASPAWIQCRKMILAFRKGDSAKKVDQAATVAGLKLRIAHEIYHKRTTAFVTRCALCNLPAELQCTGCYEALYCSLECQRQAWSAHRQTCCRA